MKLQITFVLSLLLAMGVFAGCYTQLGYYASSDFDRKYHRIVKDEKPEEHSEAEDTESEELEPEHADAEEAEGYYGRRKYTRRETYVYPRRYHGSSWGPYPLYPYRAYMPVIPYYSHPWFYGYGYYGYSPYYRNYR